ncbi:SOS response-associated peptidase [Echinicola marina]|uniref:SOS response-associated peptidase n=1 Tax=Echinicola marina TaxID=2859768 RepID=UPI001CF6A9EB|nr:SOS response-associated peptidase [Echinicola marina]UCS92294.1 SOS response-associated peptidase [Echinicola marina]
MCYHVSLNKDIKTVEKDFDKKVAEPDRFQSGYHLNGFAQPYLPVLSTHDKKAIHMYRWKLFPHWVKDESSWRANTLNAKGEELFEKGSYKAYWKNRCLVICNGFFEPHHPYGQKKAQSYYIRPKEGGYFTLGAIYSVWHDIPTFSIITVPANPLLEEIHNEKKRMPLVLDGDQAEAWLIEDLNKDEMTDLMVPYPNDSKMEGYRVMDGVTNSRLDTNVPEVLEPI